MSLGELLQWGIPIATVAAAWAGVKVGLNGTRSRVREIHSELRHHVHDEEIHQREIIERITRIETKLEK